MSDAHPRYRPVLWNARVSWWDRLFDRYMTWRQPMTADEARALVRRLYRLALGRSRIEVAEQVLSVKVADIFNDDDLIVIFAEQVR